MAGLTSSTGTGMDRREVTERVDQLVMRSGALSMTQKLAVLRAMHSGDVLGNRLAREMYRALGCETTEAALAQLVPVIEDALQRERRRGSGDGQGRAYRHALRRLLAVLVSRFQRAPRVRSHRPPERGSGPPGMKVVLIRCVPRNAPPIAWPRTAAGGAVAA